MTDQQWLEAKDPIKMLLFLEKRRIRARKLRLFAAACCRRAWLEITDPRCHLAIEAQEKFADGPGKQADKMELTSAHVDAEAAVADSEEETRQFGNPRAKWTHLPRPRRNHLRPGKRRRADRVDAA